MRPSPRHWLYCHSSHELRLAHHSLRQNPSLVTICHRRHDSMGCPSVAADVDRPALFDRSRRRGAGLRRPTPCRAVTFRPCPRGRLALSVIQRLQRLTYSVNDSVSMLLSATAVHAVIAVRPAHQQNMSIESINSTFSTRRRALSRDVLLACTPLSLVLAALGQSLTTASATLRFSCR